MKRKKASLVINPRAGKNLEKMADVLAVLAAADWQTRLALKEYGGHTMELAQGAAEQGQDVIVAYGGDGTLNQVVNGIMHAKKQQALVGLIPGGTANVWANEIGVPAEPAQAALALLNSEARRVDLGHISIKGRSSDTPMQSELEAPAKKSSQKPSKAPSRVRQHFLLMAGLGLDAAIMGHVSQPLKYHVGPLAVGVSTLKELPAHHPFPIEIHTTTSGGEGLVWKGEALQVVIGNTRLYADVVEMTPDAYLDDGLLDVCVITSGNPLTTMQQIMSLLLRHQPDNLTAEHFQGAHFSIRVPASIALQLDGSAVKLKDYLPKSYRPILAHDSEAEQVMITYEFDTLPRALQMAIPRTYRGPLFEDSDQSRHSGQAESDTEHEPEKPQRETDSSEPEASQEELKKLVKQGRVVKVVGVGPHPDAKDSYILAGTTTKESTGETRPVAVRISAQTALHHKNGESASLKEIAALQAGTSVVVEGKKSKRGVIKASQVVLSHS